jgi:radical SAM protein with 4Fe4S-binding SPASM domain
VHVTTSGELVSGSNDALLESLSCLQIGIRHDDLLSRKPNGQLSWLTEIRRRANELGVNVGANLILCRTVVEDFEEVLDLLAQNGFQQITLLRYKPPASVARWLTESPEPEDLRGMEARIGHWLEQKAGVVIRLDCALAFLERHLSSERARRAGLRGCVAGSRIVALGPDGSVYPCSQLIALRFCAGNLLDTRPLEIWRTSKILRKCRNRRGQRDFRQTLCGSCRAVEQCGGCLAMSNTGLGADPGCPEPFLPPLTRLGRNGRVADLREYLRSSPTISVGEYMKRYGVGQKRAISELKRFPGLVAVSSDDDSNRKNVGKRKADRYELQVDDLIGDIQETIGYTSWGFPYATREQIADGLGLAPSGSNYPAWLLQNAHNAVTEDYVQTSVSVPVEWF